MPGKILGVKANPGQAVKKGDVIVILEAMKMEKPLLAPRAGTVTSLSIKQGDTVTAGSRIAHIATEEEAR